MPLPKPDPPPSAEALLRRLAQAATADAAAGVAAFEAGFFAVPAFAGADLPAAAAACYDRAGRPHAGLLLRGLAQQMTPVRRPPPPLAAGPAAVLAHPRPATGLLRRLERLDAEHDAAAAAALFEAVLAHLPPLDEYWVHYRMALVYAELGHDDAAFLLASVALQIEPSSPSSQLPARRVAARLLQLRAWPEAAALQARWHAANPELALLDAAQQALLVPHTQTRFATMPAATAARRDRPLLPAGERPALRLCVVGRGIPHALAPLLQPEVRPAITLAELDDAELLVADGAVSVWAADGAPQPDLSVGMSPGLMRALLRTRREGGAAVVERELAEAVLIGDVFPAPNLCHFLLDQATRLALYTLAGLDVANATVVGPDLARPYQHEIARRLGARRYLGTAGFGRVRVRRLAVVSTCHHLRHSAHLGAGWALDAIRAAFGELRATAPHGRRLLVSRADAGGRRLADEDAAFATLRPYGFERIVPGTLSLSDQVRAFAAASDVVAPHGAALANLAFCAPGTRVLEIFHPHYGTGAYAMLAPALRLEYTAMIGFDAASDAGDDNDPALAAVRSDMSLARDLRTDLPALGDWLRRHPRRA